MRKKDNCIVIGNNVIDYLTKKGLINDYSKVIDWLLDDNKFDSKYWNSNKTKKFTNLFKKYCVSNNIEYKNNCKNIIKQNNKYYIYIYENNNIIDVIRNIRNSIAHHKASIMRRENDFYIRIISTSKNIIKSSMYIKLDFLLFLYNTYIDLKKEKYEINYKSK